MKGFFSHIKGFLARCGRRFAAVSLGIAVLSLAPNAHPTATLTLGSLVPPTNVQIHEAMNLQVEYVPEDERWVADILAHTHAARATLRSLMPDALVITIRIIVAPTKSMFLAMVGGWAENSVAVAVVAHRAHPTIILNAEEIRRGTPGNFHTTLVHELVHIYLGVRCRDPLPRWFEEGIAVNTAGEWDVEDAAAVTWAALMRGLIPLVQLEHSFPTNLAAQQLAYRESASVVQFMMRQRQTSLTGLVSHFIGEAGRLEIARLWNPLYRDPLELAWRKELRSLRNWAMLSFHSGIFWAALALLTIAAWYAKRVRNLARRREWEEEERIYQVLDQEESYPNEELDEDSADEEEPRPPWYS